MKKGELLAGLAAFKASKENSPGIANIIQLVMDILIEDMEHSAKGYAADYQSEVTNL